MRILFATKIIEDRNLQPLGIYPLSAMLKQGGHDTALVDAVSELDVFDAIDRFHPDILAVSTPTARYRFFQKLCRNVKERNPEVFTLVGGIHVTMLPGSIADEGIDAICRGEGDFVFPALVNRLANKESFEDIPGIWSEMYGEITENGVAPLIKNLDKLPFPDRSITDSYPYCRKMPVGLFMTSRGCPFRCTFCSNAHLQTLYERDDGPFFRSYTPRRAIAEVREAVATYGYRRLVFLSEVFSVKESWLEEFVELYLQGPRLPFWSMFYPTMIDERRAALLARAGCTIVELGLETGNEVLRRDLLNRPISNETIVESVRILHRHGIQVQTSNILALPGATLENEIETLDLNIRANVDFPDICIFQPLPKVPLEDVAISFGTYNGDFDSLPKTINPAVVETVPRTHPKREQVERLAFLFPLAAKSPVVRKLLPQLLELPLRPFYLTLYKMTIAWYKVKYVFGATEAMNREFLKVLWAYLKY